MNRYLKGSHQLAALNSPAALRRAGLTIMETMFAIGVILIGLLGLAAVIPVAAKQAKATLDADRATADATIGLAIASVNGFTDPGFRNLYVLDDDDSNEDPYKIFDNSGVVVAKTGRYRLSGLVAQTGGVTPLPGPDRIVRFNPRIHSNVRNTFDSPGFGNVGRRHRTSSTTVLNGRFAGVCIDPRFLASATAPDLTTGIRRGTFPYYAPQVNPFVSPAADLASSSWGLSPRMWRVGLLRDPIPPRQTAADDGRELLAEFRIVQYPKPLPGPPTPPPNPPEYFWDVAPRSADRQFQLFGTRAETDHLFLFESDYIWQKPEDRSLGTAAYFNSGRRISNNRYSWIATISQVGGSDIYSRELSIVVMENRDIPDLASSTNTVGGTPPQERLTWVARAIGFTGGSGGDIELVGSDFVSNEVKPGSWVMLSRQMWGNRNSPPSNYLTPNNFFADEIKVMAAAPDTPEPIGASIHRWYRVVDAMDPVQTTYHGESVWSRQVSLAGPDWVFGAQDGSGVLQREAGTFCTIVDGAIAVTTSPLQ